MVFPGNIVAQGLAPQAIPGGRHLVDRWTVEDGLPNNSLTSLLPSRDGYLWVASLAGVWKFDGVRFTPIPIELPSSHVRVLLEDHTGRLWIGTVGAGLFRVSGGRVDQFRRPELAGADVRGSVKMPTDGSGRRLKTA